MDAERGLFALHQAHRHEAIALRYAGRHYLTNGRVSRSTPIDPRRRLADEIERHVQEALQRLGYQAERAGPNARYDLVLDGALRVEVKAARWHANGTRGRYQALWHNAADVIVLACVSADGTVSHFIIPSTAMAGTVNLAIWSENPSDYAGRWATWYERWDCIGDVLADLPARWEQARLW